MVRSRLFASIALFLFTAVVLAGCYTTRKGKERGTEQLKRQVAETSYPVDVRYEAGPKETISLQVRHSRTYEISYRTEYQKVRSRRSLPWILAGAAGLGASIAGIATYPGCGYGGTPCQTVERGNQAQQSAYLTLGGIGATLIGTSGLVWAGMGDGVPLEGSIFEGPLTRTETSGPAPVAGEPVRVRLKNTTRQYQTDSTGTITIRPGPDFGLKTIEEPRPLVATLIFPKRQATQEVTLNPKEWMRPYVRITEANQPLRLGPDGSVVGRTRAEDAGLEAPLLEQEEEWIQLELRGTTSWLSEKEGAEVFWASPAYTPTTPAPDQRPSLAARINTEGFKGAQNEPILDAEEKATVLLTLTNRGDGPARNVQVRLSPDSLPHLRYETEVRVGDVEAGESVRRSIPLAAGRAVETGEHSLEFRFREAGGFGPSPTEFSFRTRGMVDIWQDLPETPADRPNAVALVIGIRDYANEQVPNVEYARRDARLMRRYLTEVLGYREENILPRNPDGRMTYAEMRTLIQEKLPSYVRGDSSEIFVYYSGHGAPSTGENRHGYLVPSDTDPNNVSDANAYRLGQFYEDLAEASAESVTLLLDACFTGQSRSGKMMIRQASPLVLSVENPLLAIEDATAFLASGPEQVANWYAEKRHGMFTYFFLKGLKGEADLNGDQKVTVAEMERYLTSGSEGIPYWSQRVHQREQVPQVVSQKKDRALVRFR